MVIKPLTRARIGVLLGGQSPEREISLRSGQAIHRALIRRGYTAVAIDVDASLPQQLLARKVEVAFLALHGPGGEDGSIQGLLEIVGMPYTGSGVKASAIAMHKATAKVLLQRDGIPVPKGAVVWAGGRRAGRSHALPKGMTWPVVVKPAAQGSTIGVSVVRRATDWRSALRRAHAFGREAVVESYIPGHEVAVSVLGGRTRPMALPAIEIVAPDGFYDYAAKYEKGRTRYLCPAPLPAEVTRRVRDLALRAYEVIGCQGAARVDLRVTPRGRPYVLEVNTIPGMTETSLLPMAAAKAGLDYDTLTERILESAVERWRTSHPSAAPMLPGQRGLVQ